MSSLEKKSLKHIYFNAILNNFKSYGGPESQQVNYRFRVRTLETYLCVNFGIIIAVLDGRGTGYNGDAFAKVIYKKLGEFETQDQITLAEYI